MYLLPQVTKYPSVPRVKGETNTGTVDPDNGQNVPGVTRSEPFSSSPESLPKTEFPTRWCRLACALDPLRLLSTRAWFPKKSHFHTHFITQNFHI